MPGKQNYSLAIAWAVDHDPVEAVKEVLARSAEEEEEEGDEGKEGPSARVAYQQRHGSVEVATHPAVLQMKRSASAADTQVRAWSTFTFISSQALKNLHEAYERSLKLKCSCLHMSAVLSRVVNRLLWT